MESRAESDEIQDGVLAAVMRVACVSALGARELVMEFDAARNAIGAGTRAREGLLGDVFQQGLSTDALRRMVRLQVCEDERLHALERGVQVLRGRGGQLAQYRQLVIDAARAAARTRLTHSIFGRRISLAEKAAMREIRAVLGDS